MRLSLDDFVLREMHKSKHLVPARVQAALALLERLRVMPSLDLHNHLASRGSSGLESHESFGNLAHQRFQLEAINKNHGRRSSNLQDWGQELLDLLRSVGFEAANERQRSALLDEAQGCLASLLKQLLEQEPLELRIRGRTAEWAVGDVLRQADGKGKLGDVAQYLVGAKLMLRLDCMLEPHGSNKGDRRRRGDRQARLGDYEVEDAVIEVAMGLPDEKHLAQIVEALEATNKEVRLLTSASRLETWQKEFARLADIDPRRVTANSVESFVGQNISEMGGFADKGRIPHFQKLVEIYNAHWVDRIGTPGIRIVVR